MEMADAVPVVRVRVGRGLDHQRADHVGTRNLPDVPGDFDGDQFRAVECLLSAACLNGGTSGGAASARRSLTYVGRYQDVDLGALPHPTVLMPFEGFAG